MGKLVSVIMPTYNTKKKYLVAAMDSILHQSYRDVELIIVDSSESSEVHELILERKDKRIFYFFREKKGIADALNYGLNIANGEYIARMDADDISSPLRLEKQVLFLEKNLDIDVVGTYFDRIDSDGNIIEHKSCLGAGDDGSIKSDMIFDNPISHPSVMFRRKVIDAGWRYHNVQAEDHDLWCRMLPNVKFANVEENLVSYRQHEGCISFQRSRYLMAREVAEATKKYVEDLFKIDTVEFMTEDFSKNYYLYFFVHAFSKNLTEYIMRQFTLLQCIHQKNEEKHVVAASSLNLAFNRRWITIMELTDCVFMELRDLYKFLKYDMPKDAFFIDYMIKRYISSQKIYEKIKELFRANESLLREQFSDRKNFLMYGMGEQGQLVLEKCEQLAKEDKFSWTLQGIVDRRQISIRFLNRTYQSMQKEQIINMDFDYILVSSSWYFEEIKKELVELGIGEEKIIRDGGLYLID